MIDVIHRKPRLEIELVEAQLDADHYYDLLNDDSVQSPPNGLFEQYVNNYLEATRRIGKLMTQINCSCEYPVNYVGAQHLTAGEVWDDIRGVCSRCGMSV